MAARAPIIEVIIRDEVTAAMERLRRQTRSRVDQISFKGIQTGIKSFEDSISSLARTMQREMGTLVRLTGVGGFLGGGVVAGIVKAAQALSGLANTAIQTRYTAQALGMTVEQFDKLKVRAMAVGMSEQQARSSIIGVSEALRELQIEGGKSRIFQELSKGRGGKEFARELLATINGPGGITGAIRLLSTYMQGMNANAQNSFVKLFGMGSAGFADLFNFKESELAKIVHLSEPETRRYALSMANLNITWENAKKTLALALMPEMSRAITAFDKFLQGPGSKVIKEFGTWLSSLKIDWNSIERGVRSILGALTAFFDFGKSISQGDESRHRENGRVGKGSHQYRHRARSCRPCWVGWSRNTRVRIHRSADRNHRSDDRIRYRHQRFKGGVGEFQRRRGGCAGIGRLTIRTCSYAAAPRDVRGAV